MKYLVAKYFANHLFDQLTRLPLTRLSSSSCCAWWVFLIVIHPIRPPGSCISQLLRILAPSFLLWWVVGSLTLSCLSEIVLGQSITCVGGGVLTCVWGRGNAVHRTWVGGWKSSAACPLVPPSFHLHTNQSHFSLNSNTDLLLYAVKYRRLLLSDIIWGNITSLHPGVLYAPPEKRNLIFQEIFWEDLSWVYNYQCLLSSISKSRSFLRMSSSCATI